MRQHYDSVESEADFDKLPPTLQRKYFSSLERLRLAHDGHAGDTRPRSRRPSISRGPSVLPQRSGHSIVSSSSDEKNVHPALRRQPSRSRSRLQKSVVPACPAITSTSPSEFASLPPTVRRKHFSREEQILLSGRPSPVILDATDEKLYREHWGPHGPVVPRRTSSLPNRRRERERSGERFPRCRRGSEDEMDAQDLRALKWLDDSDEDLDLQLDDYHTILASTSREQNPSAPPRRSFRRGLSLSGASFHRRSTSSGSASGSASALPSVLPSAVTNWPPKLLNHTPRRQGRTSISSLEPSATHYQDPAARMKLRVYLASPQKFDEAVEFGFPSLQDQSLPPTVPRSSPGTSSTSNRTFFRDDDTPSLSNDDDDDDNDGDNDPQTPEDVTFHEHTASNQSSSDRFGLRPTVVRGVTDSFVRGRPADREMTLHMTLTRPDLRSPEEPWTSRTTVNTTPLEHTPLYIAGDQDSFWDALPDEPSRVKRLLKKMRLR